MSTSNKDEELKAVMEKMNSMFASIPDPEQFPKQYTYFMKLAKYELLVESTKRKPE